MHAQLTYTELRARLLRSSVSVRLYGITLGESATEGFTTILFSGWAAEGKERKRGTDRILHVPESKIFRRGYVEGFTHEGQPVQWFEVEQDAQVIEERYVSRALLQLIATDMVVAQAPGTIAPNGPRPTGAPPGTIEPNGPRPTGAPPGTIDPSPT